MGMDIDIGHFVGCARRYFYSWNKSKYYLNEGYFYLCDTGKKISIPTEEYHFLKLIEAIQA